MGRIMISTYGPYTSRRVQNRFFPEGPFKNSDFTSPGKAYYLILSDFVQKDTESF